MCGRYRRTTKEEELARIYHIPIPPQRELPISWNIAPSQDVLAIRFRPKTGQRSLDALRWGLVPYWAEDAKIFHPDRVGNSFRWGLSSIHKSCQPESGSAAS